MSGAAALATESCRSSSWAAAEQDPLRCLEMPSERRTDQLASSTGSRAGLDEATGPRSSSRPAGPRLRRPAPLGARPGLFDLVDEMFSQDDDVLRRSLARCSRRDDERPDRPSGTSFRRGAAVAWVIAIAEHDAVPADDDLADRRRRPAPAAIWCQHAGAAVTMLPPLPGGEPPGSSSRRPSRAVARRRRLGRTSR